MKKIGKLFLGLFLCTTLGLMSCSNDSSSNIPLLPTTNSSNEGSSGSGIPAGYVRINYQGSDSYCVWIWGDGYDKSETDKCKTWPNGIPLNGTNGAFKYVDIKMSAVPQSVSMIILDNKGNKLTTESDVIFMFPQKYNDLYLRNKDNKVYVKSDFSAVAKGMVGASVNGDQTIKVEMSGSSDAEKDEFEVTSGDKKLSVASFASGVITVSENLKDYASGITVTYTDSTGAKDIRTASFADELIDSWFAVSDISKFGYKDGKFTTWAPLASSVKVLLFADMKKAMEGSDIAETIDMVKDSKGVWTSAEVSAKVGSNKYYKYRVVNGETTYDVCDLWAKVAAKDSVATQIVDIDSAVPANGWETTYVNPFGISGSIRKSYTDAVIYEMHITDWSQAFRSSIEKDKPGTFKEITEALNNGFGEYLRDLGVTHVQILPMFEYAKCGDDDKAYNWGYNPYNWNTPESRYVQNMNDGTDAIAQMREMIKAFHDNNIAVNMDVVYNHTMGTGSGSIYDMTIPKYFYRMSGGSYASGSGCGNETATNHEMVKKYLIDSLVHWMKDLHINGFRFDLMGLAETDTMKDVYDALKEIDKNVMVYGEPWTGGTSPVVSGVTKDSIDNCASSDSENGVACFNDDFRNAVKGAEFGGFKKGQVQGVFDDDSITNGLLGSVKNIATKGFTSVFGRSINYIECHDNYTLYDKLNISLASDTALQHTDAIPTLYKSFDKLKQAELDLLKSEDKLAAAYVLLAQGTPFINGGQEFLRTKKGDPDSYAADTKEGVKWTEIDEINAIDFKMKDTYSVVYNTYKGLIALRKANPEAFGANKDASASIVAKGVTRYETGDFLVYFNASDAAAAVTTTGYSKEVDISSGKVEKKAKSSTSVPAKSFVIFEKN